MGRILEFRRTPDAPAIRWPHVSPRNPFTWTWAMICAFAVHVEGPLGCSWLWFVVMFYSAFWFLWILAHFPGGAREYLRSEGMWQEEE